jgi:two-component system response regulator PilR (NtrC family)
MSVTAPTSRRRPVRILVVDSHADTLRLMERVLRWENYEVIPARDFHEGLRLGLSRTPDVLASEIRLPDGTGWQLIERLRQAYPGLVGVAASGVGSAADVARSERAGFCLHLTKPVDFGRLREAIRQCVEKQGLN